MKSAIYVNLAEKYLACIPSRKRRPQSFKIKGKSYKRNNELAGFQFPQMIKQVQFSIIDGLFLHQIQNP